MATALRDDMLERLQAAHLPTEVADLVERALCGDTLEEAPTRLYPKRFPRPVPQRAWVNRIGVTGFRGVGPTQALDVQPGPGLTIVVGRNGSGKSSFAEGLEVALAGSVRRLHHMKTREFRSGWRNAHHGPPSVSVSLSVPGRGAVIVRRTWDDSAEIDAGTSEGLEELGWQEAIRTWRPFLGYDELAALVAEGPAHIFDAVFPLLGLDELHAALERLAARRRQFIENRKIVKLLLDTFRSRVAASPDPRAVSLAELLAEKKLDLAEIDAVLQVGAAAPAAVVTPESAIVAALARGLDEVAARLDSVPEPDPGLAIDLLAAALRWQTDDVDCPVCGTGRLDDDWRSRTESVLAEHRAIGASRSRRRELTDWARRLVGPKPEDPALLAAWDRWDAQPASPGALAAHLRNAFPAWEAAVLAWRSARADAEAGWGPLVADGRRWLIARRSDEDDDLAARQLDHAIDWLRSTGDALRAERFAPIREQTLRFWSLLRQGSSVEIADIALGGSATRRRVEVAVNLEGARSAALGVMSQGEVTSLALSLFLPRVLLPESPFGFVVIDDPIQSMDPHKVDGLARVLKEVAATRQVILFTHDTRLTAAVRRPKIPARVLRVSRGARSSIEIRSERTPADSWMEDAAHVAHRVDELGEDLARRVVPGLCRGAVEAVLVDRIRRVRLSQGESETEVQEAIDSAPKLMPRFALALFDDADRAKDVKLEIRRELGHDMVGVVEALNRGSHGDFQGHARNLFEQSYALIRKLESM